MKIDKIELIDKAEQIRNRFSEDNRSAIDVFNIARSIKDLTLVLLPLGDNISGLCIRMERSSLIAVNSACSRGRQNFTMAHELYHYFFSKKDSSNICPMNEDKNSDEEVKANLFASYFLIPRLSLNEKMKDRKADIEMIVQLEQYYRVSHAAMLVRLAMEGYIKDKEKDSLQKNVIRSARSLGYSTDLYLSDNEKATYGYYIEKADQLYKKKRISQGKKEEYLLEALREDLVYGDKRENEYVID